MALAGRRLDHDAGADDGSRVLPQRLEAGDIHGRRTTKVDCDADARVGQASRGPLPELAFDETLGKSVSVGQADLRRRGAPEQAEIALVANLQVVDLGFDTRNRQRRVDDNIACVPLVSQHGDIRTDRRRPVGARCQFLR